MRERLRAENTGAVFNPHLGLSSKPNLPRLFSPDPALEENPEQSLHQLLLSVPGTRLGPQQAQKMQVGLVG